MVNLNRVVMQSSRRRMIGALEPSTLEVAEVSGKWDACFDFKSYEQFRHPAYDICAGPDTDTDSGEIHQFELMPANQVWEHLDRPFATTQNVYKMLRKGGFFGVVVPFTLPLHAAPQDNSRWSARGSKNLLIECGFDEDAIHAKQWGNEHATKRNLEKPWPPVYDEETDDLKSDQEMPICAWALALKVA